MPRSLFDRVAPEGTTPAVPASPGPPDLYGRSAGHGRGVSNFPDVDHNFIQEFQTGGFSHRVLELALFAYLQEQGYDLDRSAPAPTSS